eukprot:Nk52_evm19s255 gene=Nk52_evmTU19s255
MRHSASSKILSKRGLTTFQITALVLLLGIALIFALRHSLSRRGEDDGQKDEPPMLLNRREATVTDHEAEIIKQEITSLYMMIDTQIQNTKRECTLAGCVCSKEQVADCQVDADKIEKSECETKSSFADLARQTPNRCGKGKLDEFVPIRNEGLGDTSCTSTRGEKNIVKKAQYEFLRHEHKRYVKTEGVDCEVPIECPKYGKWEFVKDDDCYAKAISYLPTENRSEQERREELKRILFDEKVINGHADWEFGIYRFTRDVKQENDGGPTEPTEAYKYCLKGSGDTDMLCGEAFKKCTPEGEEAEQKPAGRDLKEGVCNHSGTCQASGADGQTELQYAGAFTGKKNVLYSVPFEVLIGQRTEDCSVPCECTITKSVSDCIISDNLGVCSKEIKGTQSITYTGDDSCIIPQNRNENCLVECPECTDDSLYSTGDCNCEKNTKDIIFDQNEAKNCYNAHPATRDCTQDEFDRECKVDCTFTVVEDWGKCMPNKETGTCANKTIIGKMTREVSVSRQKYGGQECKDEDIAEVKECNFECNDCRDEDYNIPNGNCVCASGEREYKLKNDPVLCYGPPAKYKTCPDELFKDSCTRNCEYEIEWEECIPEKKTGVCKKGTIDGLKKGRVSIKQKEQYGGICEVGEEVKGECTFQCHECTEDKYTATGEKCSCEADKPTKAVVLDEEKADNCYDSKKITSKECSDDELNRDCGENCKATLSDWTGCIPKKQNYVCENETFDGIETRTITITQEAKYGGSCEEEKLPKERECKSPCRVCDEKEYEKTCNCKTNLYEHKLRPGVEEALESPCRFPSQEQCFCEAQITKIQCSDIADEDLFGNSDVYLSRVALITENTENTKVIEKAIMPNTGKYELGSNQHSLTWVFTDSEPENGEIRAQDMHGRKITPLPIYKEEEDYTLQFALKDKDNHFENDVIGVGYIENFYRECDSAQANANVIGKLGSREVVKFYYTHEDDEEQLNKDKFEKALDDSLREHDKRKKNRRGGARKLPTVTCTMTCEMRPRN